MKPDLNKCVGFSKYEKLRPGWFQPEISTFLCALSFKGTTKWSHKFLNQFFKLFKN